MIRFLALLGCCFPSAVAFADESPGKRLDLSSWMLTLPYSVQDAKSPDEVKQPQLDQFSDTRYFFVDANWGGVVFRANCGGRTTKGSRFPRCELREMSDQGKRRAAWSTDDRARHSMTLLALITRTPDVKKHVVCAQIHDDQDDLLMIRLEGKKLFIERNEIGNVMLDDRYVIGTPFQIRFEAGNGQVKVWHNESLKLTWDVSRDNCYFKSGCYTQSNTSTGDAPESYGEVVIRKLVVEHRNDL